MSCCLNPRRPPTAIAGCVRSNTARPSPPTPACLLRIYAISQVKTACPAITRRNGLFARFAAFVVRISPGAAASNLQTGSRWRWRPSTHRSRQKVPGTLTQTPEPVGWNPVRAQRPDRLTRLAQVTCRAVLRLRPALAPAQERRYTTGCPYPWRTKIQLTSGHGFLTMTFSFQGSKPL